MLVATLSAAQRIRYPHVDARDELIRHNTQHFTTGFVPQAQPHQQHISQEVTSEADNDLVIYDDCGAHVAGEGEFVRADEQLALAPSPKNLGQTALSLPAEC